MSAKRADIASESLLTWFRLPFGAILWLDSLMKRRSLTIAIWLAAVLSALSAPRARTQAADQPAPAGCERESALQSIRFSSFDWQVKTSLANVGPGPNIFGPEGVQVDRRGRLHLAIGLHRGRWMCSELVSKRSFGYGEYRFVIQETANLDTNVVLGLFLWDRNAPEHQFRETDIELSRWGDERKPNAQFVIQPYLRPENLDRFELPPGRAELSLRWTPGQLFCRALVHGKVVREHLFAHGVPEPGRENVRLNLWLYRAPPANGKEVEAVIERFEFLPLGKGK